VGKAKADGAFRIYEHLEIGLYDRRLDMKRGFFRLYRKTVKDDPVFQNANLFKLYCLCHSKAAHKHIEVMGDTDVVKLQPGQFVSGRFDLHGDFHQWKDGFERRSPHPDTVWRWLKKLEKAKKLHIQSTNKYSIITIIYEELSTEVAQQAHKSCTHRRINKHLEESNILYLPSPTVQVDKGASKPSKKKETKGSSAHWARLWKACAEVDHLFSWSARSFTQSARRQSYRLDVIAHALEELAREPEPPTGRAAEEYCWEIIRREGRSTRWGRVGYKEGSR